MSLHPGPRATYWQPARYCNGHFALPVIAAIRYVHICHTIPRSAYLCHSIRGTIDYLNTRSTHHSHCYLLFTCAERVVRSQLGVFDIESGAAALMNMVPSVVRISFFAGVLLRCCCSRDVEATGSSLSIPTYTCRWVVGVKEGLGPVAAARIAQRHSMKILGQVYVGL